MSRVPKKDDVVLMHGLDGRSRWCHVMRYRASSKDAPFILSFTASFEPDDPDLRDGFWVDFAWTSSTRGARGDMRWLGPESESVYP